ncbi:MAG: hypothetical protein WA354_00405 [Terracidiphilus sp.]
MKSKNWNQFAVTIARLFLLVAIAAAWIGVNAQAPTRFVGTLTAINGSTITVKTDAGDSKQVEVPATAVMKRLAPGQKDLSAAETIHLTDLATGDRVLVKLDPDATGATPRALQVVAMKQTDIAQRQQQEREEWQRNGAGGLVKSVDAAAGVVIVTTGAGPTAKTVTVHITKTTVLKRYSATSIRFADAQPAPLDAVHAGDQFQVLGQKNADGSEITATDVVSGSFRNISGIVVSVDATASTLTVKDLVTKKNVMVHVTPDAEMRRLPEMMAKMIAARLKGGASAAGGATTMGRAQGGEPATSAPAGYGPGAGQGGGQGRRGAGGNLAQVLDRAPTVKLGDLQKGEAVMLVSTEGATDVTAIKLLAGVEPLLESPDASRDLLANWSMGSGGAEAAAQ